MKKKYNTLVLNRHYIPIHIIEYKRAISLLYQDLAKSLDQDLMPYSYKEWIDHCNLPTFDETYYKFIHSVDTTVAIPDILVLQKYDKLPKRDTKYTRENVFTRDNNKCAYCGKKFRRDKLTVDHIVPKSKGGNNSWDNTISACKVCNHTKADRNPEEAGMPLLFKPHEPRWCDTLSKAAATPELRNNWDKFLKFIGA